eukprot:1429819-Prymnesium_polylepis.1
MRRVNTITWLQREFECAIVVRRGGYTLPSRTVHSAAAEACVVSRGHQGRANRGARLAHLWAASYRWARLRESQAAASVGGSPRTRWRLLRCSRGALASSNNEVRRPRWLQRDLPPRSRSMANAQRSYVSADVSAVRCAFETSRRCAESSPDGLSPQYTRAREVGTLACVRGLAFKAVECERPSASVHWRTHAQDITPPKPAHAAKGARALVKHAD